jgi:hypothetical protein
MLCYAAKEVVPPGLAIQIKSEISLLSLSHMCRRIQYGHRMHTHTEVGERALTGTWVMDEVRLAVQKGYKVTEVYEVYEYETTQCVPQSRDGGLFVDYINTFLKLKAEASGFPTWVRTREDEESYIKAFYESEGVQLDRDTIRPNAAKRGIAKLCLNSMWGKLTERNNRPKTKMISEPQELYRLLATPGIEVVTLLFCSDDVWVSWTFTEEQAPSLRHNNDVLGSYVTAGARLRLQLSRQAARGRCTVIRQRSVCTEN